MPYFLPARFAHGDAINRVTRYGEKKKETMVFSVGRSCLSVELCRGCNSRLMEETAAHGRHKRIAARVQQLGCRCILWLFGQ